MDLQLEMRMFAIIEKRNRVSESKHDYNCQNPWNLKLGQFFYKWIEYEGKQYGNSKRQKETCRNFQYSKCHDERDETEKIEDSF